MAEKNLDTQIAEKEAEITKLKDEQEKLRQKATYTEYPKWIPDPTDESGAAGRTVASKEEEESVLVSYADANAKAKKQRELDKKIADLKAAYDKEQEAEAEKVKAQAAKDAKGKK